ENIRHHFGDKITLVNDAYEALIDVDALAIITEWSVFRTPNFEVMKSLMTQPVIFDGRNLYEVDYMAEKGFYYESIGRRKALLESGLRFIEALYAAVWVLIVRSIRLGLSPGRLSRLRVSTRLR